MCSIRARLCASADTAGRAVSLGEPPRRARCVAEPVVLLAQARRCDEEAGPGVRALALRKLAAFAETGRDEGAVPCRGRATAFGCRALLRRACAEVVAASAGALRTVSLDETCDVEDLAEEATEAVSSEALPRRRLPPRGSRGVAAAAFEGRRLLRADGRSCDEATECCVLGHAGRGGGSGNEESCA